MNKIKYLLLIPAFLALTAFAKDDHKTVSYYEAHEAEAKSKLVWCKDDADRMNTADCHNAYSGLQKAGQKKPSAVDTFKYKPTTWRDAEKSNKDAGLNK